MNLVMHQPEFCPYLGFFGKVSKCDTFMFSDDVQFEKKAFQNRNQIVDWNGVVTFITVPIQKHNHKLFKDVKIGNVKDWRQKILNQLRNNYSRCVYFDQIYSQFCQILCKQYIYLNELNQELIKYFFRKFQLAPKIISTCSYEENKSVTQQILQILQKLNCDKYISGSGSKDYMDLQIINKSNRNIEFYEYEQVKYKQRCKQFVPYMSCLDFLFSNRGTFKDGFLIKKD